MSVIIRLQNLPWSANALDIRQYFSGLNIPEGGVNIVGGELGDAFIAFSTDEDARQAFQRNNGKIKEVQISLMLSSRTEMQRVIEQARSQTYSVFMGQSTRTHVQHGTTALPMPTAVPGTIPGSISASDPRDKDRSGNDKRRRSRSRDRRDRSRDRKDRRHRSRSRSRDRRSRRRGRSRSRSRERSHRSREDRRRSDEGRSSGGYSTKPQQKIDPWAQNSAAQQLHQQPSLLANIAALGNLGVINPLLGATSLQTASVLASTTSNSSRDSWPPAQATITSTNNLTNLKTNGNLHSRDPRQSKMFNDDDESQFDRNNPKGVYSTNYNSRSVDDDKNKTKEIRFTPNCCIKMEPFYGAYGDVRRFFHGNFISSKGIKFINDQFGTRTGIVFVQFATMQGKVNALQKNDEILNGVSVSITHINDHDFDEAVDRFYPFDDGDKSSRSYHSKYALINKKDKPEELITNFSSLTVEDLPTYVKEQDILKMFSIFPLTSLILTSKGKNGHIAYVKFSTEEDAKKALNETALHSIEGKPVTVKPCKDEDFETINKQHEVDLTPSSQKLLDTDCLSISGLPLKTNDRDVADFFSDIGIIPSKIHLMNNHIGFTGQAYCEFRSEAEATKGSKKDGSSIGSSVISLRPISRKDMEPIVQVKMDDEGVTENVEHTEEYEEPGQDYYSNYRDDDYSGMPYQSHRGRRYNRHDGSMRGRGGFMPSRGRGPPPHRYMPTNYDSMEDNEFEETPLLGCTVYMNNIPYKAGTNEILDFFEGYGVTDNVSRRYNANNTPTAEAKVTFETPEDASRAVEELNGKKIWDRPIYLNQV